MSASEPPTPLYVRLPADQARRLDAAAASSGRSKRHIVAEAVAEHLGDAGLAVGRVALREEAPAVLTAGEAAALLRLDEPDLVAAAGRGEVPGRQVAGAWRFSRAALLAWLAA